MTKECKGLSRDTDSLAINDKALARPALIICDTKEPFLHKQRLQTLLDLINQMMSTSILYNAQF